MTTNTPAREDALDDFNAAIDAYFAAVDAASLDATAAAVKASVLADGVAVSKITYKTLEGCFRCTTDIYVPHYNCRRPGVSGHSDSHCTANACY